jgi:predicted DNA-binding protein (MmcQ/YjbR family)
MNIDWVRELCLSFHHATEQTVWADDLTFKVGGKMFAHAVLVPASVWLSFKASLENFAELTERPGVIPAPYLARAQWVALETKEALSPNELARLLRESYDMVVAKLPKNMRDTIAQTLDSSKKPRATKSNAKKRLLKSRRKRKKPRP